MNAAMASRATGVTGRNSRPRGVTHPVEMPRSASQLISAWKAVPGVTSTNVDAAGAAWAAGCAAGDGVGAAVAGGTPTTVVSTRKAAQASATGRVVRVGMGCPSRSSPGVGW